MFFLSLALEPVRRTPARFLLGEGTPHLEVHLPTYNIIKQEQDIPFPYQGHSYLSDILSHSSQSMDGFFFLLAADGRVLFVSENVDKFLGYSQIDVSSLLCKRLTLRLSSSAR